jgi:hypothetical protein
MPLPGPTASKCLEACAQGDVTSPEVLRPFLDFEVLFYGPPLSVECDAHRSLSFREVVPPFGHVAALLLGHTQAW